MPESPEAQSSANRPPPQPILLYAASDFGGIAEHSHYQAQELADRGWPVTVLCHPHFLRRPHRARYRRLPLLHSIAGSGWFARLGRAAAFVYDHYLLAWLILREKPKVVLLDCASEYFVPFWLWPHLLLRRAGVRYIANFHDPVRVRQFGPEWLHRWSLAGMYRLLDGGLVHGPVPPEAAIPAKVRLIEAPLGTFTDALQVRPAQDLRQHFGIAPGACVVLAFGHIADRKNLDLLIHAIALLPDMVLIIAGQSTSEAQRPPAFYRQLAGDLGIADRVILCAEFIDDARIPDFFAAADIVALTYNAAFVSQSGVLQHAVAFRKPVLASCGPGPLRQSMEQFALGTLIPPDDVAAIAGGLSALALAPPVPEAVFRAYETRSSWSANIDRLIKLIGAVDSATR